MLATFSYILNTIFFFLMFSVLFLVARATIISKKNADKNGKSFWEREAEANSVRRQDISKLEYILLPVNTLPMDALIAIHEQKLHDDLMSFETIKTLNLSSYSNTDLKLMYGPANLNTLSACDENFTRLIRLLHKAGSVLCNASDSSSAAAAISFLEYAVSIGSDISGTYELLGLLYQKNDNREAFESLLESASKLTSLSRDTTLSKLNNIKITWK